MKENNEDSFPDILTEHFNDQFEMQSNIVKTESPIEELLLTQLYLFKSHGVKIIPQYQVKTISGDFRADIALIKDDNIILIECDGKEFHKNRSYYDSWRDALIIASTDIRSIFRFCGFDINFRLHDVIYFINLRESIFIDSESINRFINIITATVRDDTYYMRTRDGYLYIDPNEQQKREIYFTHKNRDLSRSETREVVISYLNPGKCIDELISDKTYYNLSTEELLELFKNKYPKVN